MDTDEVCPKVSDIVSPPEDKDVIYQLTCVICGQDSGIHAASCTNGHSICDFCLTDDLNNKCPVKEYDENRVESACSQNLFVIDDAIRNTPYYKLFMSQAVYNCTAAALGCEEKLTGDKIRDHELNYCRFRAIYWCSYNMDGCDDRFQGVQSHITHLIQEHETPVSHEGRGHFLVRYDRQEYMNAESNLVPLIRAVICGQSKSVTLLMAKDIREHKTRIWMAWCGRLKKDEGLTAEVRVYPQQPQGSHFESDKFVAKKVMPVIPFVESIVNHDELDEHLFFDLDNSVLDEFKLEKDGKKYFNLLVKIDIIRVNDEGQMMKSEEEHEVDNGDVQNADEQNDTNVTSERNDVNVHIECNEANIPLECNDTTVPLEDANLPSECDDADVLLQHNEDNHHDTQVFATEEIVGKDLRDYLWGLATDKDLEMDSGLDGTNDIEGPDAVNFEEQKQEELEPIIAETESNQVDEQFSFQIPPELKTFTIGYIDDEDLEELHLRQDEYIHERDLAYEEYEERQRLD